jgi:DNA-binding CsgD family transcriptional regulator
VRARVVTEQRDGTDGLLIERDGVLTALSEHLAMATRGQGRVVLLPGEAGVGKTAVLERFVGRASPMVEVLRGWCDPLSTPRPLGPWMDIAPGLAAEAQEEFERTAGWAGGISALFRAVLQALAPGVVRLVVFEDLHWADEASLDLIRLLVRRIEQLPILLVASYRDDEIGPSHPVRVLLGDLAGMSAVHRCQVQPLSPDGVARLVAGRGLDVDELYRVTGGNAFFVTEVLAAGGGGIPATVGDAVAGRLGRVSAAARRTAEVVAVLGSPAPARLVFDLVEGATHSMEELLGAGVLYPCGDGLGFRHELARMVVLDGIPAFDRATLHTQVFDHLRGDPAYSGDNALLAHHAEAAGQGNAVLEFAPLAAAQATASGAHREAAAQYRRALRFAGQLPPARRASLLEDLAQSSFLAGQAPAGIGAMRDALELRRDLSDQLREGADLRWLSLTLWPIGHSQEAWRTGERALQVLEALAPSRELAWAYVTMCQLAAYNRRGVPTAETYAQRAVSLAELFQDPEAEWQARFHLALTRFAGADQNSSSDDGWADMHLAQCKMVDAGFIEAGAFLAMLSGISAAQHHDPVRAASALETLEILAQDRDLLTYLRIGNALRTFCLLHRGSWGEAAELAAAILDQPGLAPAGRIMPLLALGTIRARRGDPGVRDVLNEAAEIFEPCGWTPLVGAARAEAAWLDGDLALARQEAQQGLKDTTPHSDPWAVGELARWIRLTGAEPRAMRAAGPFTLELSGDWRAAAQAWEKLRCPYDAALSRLAGDVAAVGQAVEEFESLGARRARAQLKAMGVRYGTRGPRAAARAHPYGLTAREQEVLALLREGLTGPQIAARMCIAPKTANHHVTAILAKLGVHSRAEAVRKLAD